MGCGGVRWGAVGCRGLGSPVWMLIFHWFSRDHPPGIDGVNDGDDYEVDRCWW